MSPILGVMLLLAAPGASRGQSTNPHEFATNLAGATTIASPPKGFGILTASDEQLADYGFPPRPDQGSFPKEYARWAKAMLASRTRIVPKLQQTDIFHGPARLREGAKAEAQTEFESYNWSGYVNLNGATRFGQSSFYAIATDLVVPTAREAFGVCLGDAVYASSWAGMDGFKSNDVLQAGIEFDAACVGGATATLYSAWFEWYPSPEVRITNLPIAPGDDFYIQVWNTSATQGYAYLVNENEYESATIRFHPPAGTKLVGNSAEWITERPEVNGQPVTLTNYIAEPYWDAFGVTHNHRGFNPIRSNPLIMLDNEGTEISYPMLLGDSAFLMQNISSGGAGASGGEGNPLSR